MRYDNFIPQPRLIKIHSRGRLPHWEVDDAVYFITFRLRDSLPRSVIELLILEREHMLRGVTTDAERVKLDHAISLRLDHHLDQNHGSCILREYGQLVVTALEHFDGERYDLHAWCVMPNHVHVLVHVERGQDVPNIVQAWKSYTAHRIGRGVIWQREYFDRLIRSPREFGETATYIRANPAKAGFADWPWVG